MSTTKTDISTWFDRGIEAEARYMIVVCDTFDYDDYPVYIGINDNFWKIYAKYASTSMYRIIEIYDLFQDKEYQLEMDQSSIILNEIKKST